MSLDTDQPDLQRATRLDSLLREVKQKRAKGEHLSDQSVIAANSDLMPELGKRLHYLSIVSAAMNRDGKKTNRVTEGHDDSEPTCLLCPRCREVLPPPSANQSEHVACATCGCRFIVAVGDECNSERPSMVGGFELQVCIGLGAFGEVWCARDTKLDRLVAVKIPRKRQLSRDERELFLREARSAAQLNHPNIVKIYEAGCDGDTVFIVSDLILGDTLTERMEVDPPTFRESAELCKKIGLALHDAHLAGVIHRDLKPSNILMDEGGEPRVTDFGLAKRDAEEVSITLDGQLLGTPAYMSPEQVRGEAHLCDARTDVYALGVLLFQLLTGEVPFRGDPLTIFQQIEGDDPPSPRRFNSAVPQDLETICLKCLEKEPSHRYESAEQVALDLERWLEGFPIHARPAGISSRLSKWSRRRPMAALLVLLVMATIIGGAVATRWHISKISGALVEVLNEKFRADQAQAATKENLYRSLVREIQAIRNARREGYRERAWSILEEARRLKSDPDSIAELRRKAVACMGDFLGLAPSVIDRFPAEPILSALNADASRLAVALDNQTVSLRDVASGQEITTFALPSRVVSLEFSDEDLYILDEDRFLRTYRPESGIQWRETTAMMVEGQVVMIGALGNQRSMYLVEQERLKPQIFPFDQPSAEKPLKLRRTGPVAYAISLDAHFYAIGDDNIDVLLCIAKSGDVVHRLSTGLGIHYDLAFSPDASQLACACDEGFVVFDTTTGNVMISIRGDTHLRVAFDLTGDLLAATDITGQVTLWNLASHRELAVLRQSLAEPVRHVAFNDAGNRIVATDSKSVRVWNRSGTEERIAFQAHNGGIPAIAISRAGGLMATAGKDRVVKIWNAESRELVHTFTEFAGPPQSVAFSGDGRWLATGEWDNPKSCLKIWNVLEKRIERTLEHDLGDGIHAVSFGENGETFAAAGTGVQLWHVNRSAENPQPSKSLALKKLHRLSGENCNYLALTRDADYAVFVNERTNLEVLNIHSGQRQTLHAKLLRGWHSLATSPHSREVWFVSNRGVLESWDVAANVLTKSLGNEGHFQSSHVAISSQGRYLAALTRPNTVEVWNLLTETPLFVLPAERTAVWSMAWNSDGSQLVYGLADGTLVTWNFDAVRRQLRMLRLNR